MFDVYIDGVKVNQYIDQGSLDSYEQSAKGDGAFEYRVDTIDFDADLGLLDALSIDYYNIGDLKKKTSIIYYDGNIVFNGAVGGSKMNFDDYEISVELFSLGRILSDADTSELYRFTSGSSFAQTEITLDVVAAMLRTRLNWFLQYEGYALDLVLLSSVVNVIDFPFLQSLGLTELTIPSWNHTTTNGITYNFTYHHVNIGMKSSGELYLVYDTIISGQMPVFWVVEITASGLASTGQFYSLTNFNNAFSITAWLNQSNQGVKDHVLNYHGLNSSNATFRGSLDFGNIQYTLLEETVTGNKYFDRVDVIPDDLLTFNFTEGKVGDVLTGFAIMTNSIVTISPGGGLTFMNRGGASGLSTSGIKVESAEYEVEDYKHDEFEIPEEFIVSDDVRVDMNTYYTNYFAGKKLKGEFIVDKDKFSPSDYPLVTKNFFADIRGTVMDAGIITDVEYNRYLLKIKTEKRFV